MEVQVHPRSRQAIHIGYLSVGRHGKQVVSIRALCEDRGDIEFMPLKITDRIICWKLGYSTASPAILDFGIMNERVAPSWGHEKSLWMILGLGYLSLKIGLNRPDREQIRQVRRYSRYSICLYRCGLKFVNTKFIWPFRFSHPKGGTYWMRGPSTRQHISCLTGEKKGVYVLSA